MSERMDTERGRLLFGRDFSTPEREFVASASGHHPFCVVIPQHGGSVIAADLDCTLIDTDPAAGFPSLEYALSQTLELLEGNRHWRNLNDWYEANIRGMDPLLRQQLFEGAMEASSGQTDALFLLNIFRHYDGGLLESEYQFLLDMLAKFRRDYALSVSGDDSPRGVVHDDVNVLLGSLSDDARFTLCTGNPGHYFIYIKTPTLILDAVRRHPVAYTRYPGDTIRSAGFFLHGGMIGRPYKADMLEMLNQLTGGQVIFIDDNLKAFRGVPSSISCFWINRAGVARSSDLPSHVIEIETLADTRLLELCR